MEEKNFELEETLENPQQEENTSLEDNEEKNENGDEYDASDSSSDESENEVDKLRKINAQLYARLKKIEAKIKNKAVVSNDRNDDFRLDRIETKINHPELEQEHLDFLEVIAKGKGISFEEAYKTPLFQKYLQKDIEEKKIAKALGGGRDKSQAIKSLDEKIKEVSSDRDKHKEIWKEAMSGALSQKDMSD